MPGARTLLLVQAATVLVLLGALPANQAQQHQLQLAKAQKVPKKSVGPVERKKYHQRFADLLAERRRRLLLMHRRLQLLHHRPDEFGAKICFELLGCFANPQQPLTLKRPPQHPSVIQTRFHLYTRENRKGPRILEYGDNLRSMTAARLNGSRSLKVIVHGYKGSGANEGAIEGANAFLDLEDASVIIVDWARGAGTTYSLAVSNVELVGRQLGLVLLDAANLGVDTERVHLVGFSLGAHVAGCAAEFLKQHGLLVGRVTGLDPASPLFRVNLLRDRTRKLDISDARLVDVIHTDGSSDFADGFGLLKPIGHIDFFPNGGRQQPGCNDIKNSVVVSHLNEDSLDINIACSHSRAWFLFLESMKHQLGPGSSSCRFTSWPCKRRHGSFGAGRCFPPEERINAPEMGYLASRGPTGVYYLATRARPPYCGYPLRLGVKLADYDSRPRGVVTVRIDATTGGPSGSVEFKVDADGQEVGPVITMGLGGRKGTQPTFYDIQAVDPEGFRGNWTRVTALVRYEARIDEGEEASGGIPGEYILLIDKITLEDRGGNRWDWCGKNLAIGPKDESLILRYRGCNANDER